MKKLFLPLLLLIGCGTPQQNAPLKKLQDVEDAIHFYVFGDWGRKGEFKQKELAEMMNQAACVVEPEFIISTGDNFYPNGVASTQDYQWIASYEEIYSGYGLNCPWYVVLGNHDYRGSILAEIEYSNLSQRWTMPSQYFHKDIEDEGLRIRFVYLDTNPFEDEYYAEDKYKDKVAQQDTTAQLVWMDSLLADNSFDWKIVVGHHPMYTGGKRSDDPNFVRNHLEPHLKKYDVDLYLAGHEHDIQHIKPEGPTHHIISGAGSEVRPTGKLPETLFAASIQSFAVISATLKELKVQFVDYQGEVIYTTEILAN